jgi:hypothetical protein
LLQPPGGDALHWPAAPARDAAALRLSCDEFEDVIALAHLNHVVVRGLDEFLSMAREEQQSPAWLQLAESALSSEKARIAALFRLHEVCAAFQDHGYGVTVMKTLDHWPDFGSDMDLFTNAEPHEVSLLMEKCFNARMAPRSWGDHLANKWNFLLPDLPEPIEIHVGRLGQTGEQVAIASTLDNPHTAGRARRLPVPGSVHTRPADDLHAAARVPAFQHSDLRHCGQRRHCRCRPHRLQGVALPG